LGIGDERVIFLPRGIASIEARWLAFVPPVYRGAVTPLPVYREAATPPPIYRGGMNP